MCEFFKIISDTLNRITFDASDGDSGVHQIKYKLYVENITSEQGSGSIPANRNNASRHY
jgi:hypothetical protein